MQGPEVVSWLRSCQPCLDCPCCQKRTRSAGKIIELPSFGVSLLRTEVGECQGPREELCVRSCCGAGLQRLGGTAPTSPPPPARAGTAGWGADPAPGQDAGAWLLAGISTSGVSSPPVQPQAPCQHTPAPLGSAAQLTRWGELMSLLQIPLQPLPSPRHWDGFSSPLCKVIKRCTCKTLHSGKQIMQNTLSGISHKWIQPTVGTLLPGLTSGDCEKLLARLLQPGKGCSAQSSAPSQPPGTSSGEGWLVAHMAQTCWEG